MRKLLASTPVWKCTDDDGKITFHTVSFCSRLTQFEKSKKPKTIEAMQAKAASGPEEFCEECARTSLHISKSDPVEFQIVSKL